MDGIDAVLVDFAEAVQPLATQSTAYPDPLAKRLRQFVANPDQLDVAELGALDTDLGYAFASAANQLLQENDIDPAVVTAIGSHGQNIFHSPDTSSPHTRQLADPSVIAEHTAITVVADFRRRDVAAGGQGAPLAPALHAKLLRTAAEDRAVLNLGGIANLTVLPATSSQPVLGFDTGPANCLMDEWIGKHRGLSYDDDGQWAGQGQLIPELLARCLRDDYFQRSPPKSTGRERFHLSWLNARLQSSAYSPADVQRTLLELTATSVTQQLLDCLPHCQRLLLCGGGVHNGLLRQQLAAQLPGVIVESTAEHGLDPDHIEAMLFAWLARQTLAGKAGNLSSVTGAAGPRVLGAIYPA